LSAEASPQTPLGELTGKEKGGKRKGGEEVPECPNAELASLVPT